MDYELVGTTLHTLVQVYNRAGRVTSLVIPAPLPPTAFEGHSKWITFTFDHGMPNVTFLADDISSVEYQDVILPNVMVDDYKTRLPYMWLDGDFCAVLPSLLHERVPVYLHTADGARKVGAIWI